MAEQLVNEFTVNRPIDEAWAVITDVERIAPCLPGAQLQEIEGDIYRGVVKIKLGSITPQFKGQATFLERDDDAHTAPCSRPRAATPAGAATRRPRSRRRPRASRRPAPACVVTTDLHITGKVAQFGRGIIGDVSKKLMAQFAGNLNTMLDEQGLDGDAGRGRRPRRAPAAPTSAGGARRRAARRARRRRPTARVGADRARRRDASPAERRRCARSTARRASRSTSPASPARRSSSGWCPVVVGAAAPAVPPAPPALSAVTGRADPSTMEPPTTSTASAVRELLGREPPGAFEVVVRDDAGRAGRDPQRTAPRRRHADADALLAGRPRRGAGRQPAGGRRRRARGRGGGRPDGARRRPRPLRRRARRRRRRADAPVCGRRAASAARARASSASTPTTPGTSPAATTRSGAGSPTSSAPPAVDVDVGPSSTIVHATPGTTSAVARRRRRRSLRHRRARRPRPAERRRS